MWPRDRTSASEVLRIGRHAIERWQNASGTLSLLSEHALPQATAPQPQHLTEAIRMLYVSRPASPVALVLESAWLPVMLVETGPVLLRAAQLDALVRHRFGQHHSDGLDSVAAWELRIEHRAGSRYALAYGMPPRLKQTLIDVARAAGLSWAAMTPVLAWGMERLRPGKVLPRSPGWFAWPEQDRTLIARLASNEIVALHAGAPRVADEPELLRLVDAESVRCGMATITDPIVAATWAPTPRAVRTGQRVVWLDARAPNGRSAVPSLSAAPRKVPA